MFQTLMVTRSHGGRAVKLLLAVLVIVLVGCGGGGNGSQSTAIGEEATMPSGQMPQWSAAPSMQLEEGKDYRATLHTTKGVIVVDLLEADAPMTVNNFVFLANQGFYTNVPFHRIIQGFMIQTGDPTGTGSGGPGYRFADEPITRDYTRGTVAMANAGPNTNGSQFFIVQADMTGRLPKNYTIFGEVIEGMDVVDAIAAVPVRANQFGEQSVPTGPVMIERVDISAE